MYERKRVWKYKSVMVVQKMFMDMIGLPVLAFSDLIMRSGYTWLNDWAPLSALAVAATLMIHAALFVIARTLSIKEFENYATSEILQALATAIMIASLIVMVNSAIDLLTGFITGDVACDSKTISINSSNDPGHTAMDDAYDAMKCKVMSRAAKIAEIQSSVTTGAGTASEFNWLNTQLSGLGLTFYKGDWTDSIYRETETTRVTNNLATTMLIGLNAQVALINYLKANMLNMFIPLGLLLRSFYFTRGVGALFLAFGIGMYFLFPVFYILLDPGFVASTPIPTESVPTRQPYCYSTMSSAVTVLQTLQAGGLGSTGKLNQESIRDELSKSYIQLMLHPLISFFLTLIFIRYMMTVLGSDSYELVRMVGKVI